MRPEVKLLTRNDNMDPVNLRETAVAVRPGREEDAAACAAIFNAWVDATPWMPRVHPAEDVVRHYREHVLKVCRVLVAERGGAVAGFAALDGEGYVASLYVDAAARGAGVGAALVAAMKALRPEGLMLWTFVANAGARRFYAREGFVETGGTEGRERGRAAGPAADLAGDAMTARGSTLPVLTVVLGILALWYLFTVILNAPWAYDQAGRAGVELGFGDLVRETLGQDRPRLPAPHQVAVELWGSVVDVEPTSRRSLVYHAWVTLSATLLGFALGAALGVLLAAAIVHDRTSDASVMPWVIASQAVPILAVAPMIIVVLNSVGVTGLLPKALISMYLSFFPVVVGMVKGLRSPDRIMFDQMRTWNASRMQTFTKLRWPAATPYLFASLKVAAAASLVGAIIGELPTGAQAGLGARMLSGSYYGQTVQIWSALFMAAAVAAALVALIGLAERVTARAMGTQAVGAGA